MNKLSDAHFENDKALAPLLLAASFNDLLQFVGSHAEKGVLYWQFTPQHKALRIIENYYTKTEPHIPARDIFDATATFWKSVVQARNGEIYGAGK